ncbi:MAG: hypothetical protein V4850_36945 [Myxococcota bacterium]
MLFTLLSSLYAVAIFGLPALALWGALQLAQGNTLVEIVVLAFAPIAYALGSGVVAGVLSRFHRAHVVAGKFSRDLASRPYMHRRLYGLCWTAVYYFTPAYFLWLSLPGGKHALFRLFGYRGQTAFTTYPDTWVRDLPLLVLGRGAYLSNRATIGTNIVLMGGEILVDSIEVGADAIVGHLAMLAPGVVVGARAEIGVGCAIGIKVTIGEGAQFGPNCSIEHGAVIGANARVGVLTFVGSGSVVGAGVVLPPRTFVPRRTKLLTQADADALIAGAAGVGVSARSAG